MHAPTLRLAVVLVCTAASALTQAPHQVGTRDVSLPNTTGQGSAILTARVHYPATAAGSNQPVLPRTGGWPVVVFLHGFATSGTFYAPIGDALARAGYVAFLGTTATFDNQLQEYDGRASFSSLQTANAAVGGPFFGALDMTRAGLLGHSMGGGNVGNVLAINPGFRCGMGLAPVTPRGANAGLVAVPMAIMVGTGDTIAPASTYAQPFYAALTAVTGMKSYTLLNGDCTHTNIAGIGATSGTSLLVFQRAMTQARGFFARWLYDEAQGLEEVVGLAARAEPRLVSLAIEVERPDVWPAAALRIGITTRLSVAAEPGPAGILAANGPGSLSTPFGTLLLDPATTFVAIAGSAGAERRLDGSVSVPNAPGFLGVQITVQAYGLVRAGTLRLGASTILIVQP